jgi:uncharacterized protein YggE
LKIKRIALCLTPILLFAITTMAQGPDIKYIADTLVVQADGTYEADPDLATLTFDISSQDKDLKPTYDKASGAMRKIADLAEKNGLKKRMFPAESCDLQTLMCNSWLGFRRYKTRR